MAEDILFDLLGPVAPILVSSAASKTKHIGDLYLLLSNELEGTDKEEFLSLVDHLNV